MRLIAKDLLMDKPYTALGFDFGLYHIGLSVGQSITQKATPIGSMDAKKGKPNWDAMDAFIAKWQPDHLVVGMPYTLDGGHQAISLAALKFIAALKKRYPHCQIHEHDERYTTQLAKTAIVEKQGGKALSKDNIDAVSAQLILEGWLMVHQNDGSTP